MRSDEGVRESCLFIFWRHRRAGEERKVCIETNKHARLRPHRHGIKHQVLVMQGVPPGLDKNLVLCIGLDVLLDRKGDTVALGLDDASFNVLGLKCSQIVKAVVRDTPPCTCALTSMCALMEVPSLLRTMRTMSRSLR
jgi:hypothetical protein